MVVLQDGSVVVQRGRVRPAQVQPVSVCPGIPQSGPSFHHLHRRTLTWFGCGSCWWFLCVQSHGWPLQTTWQRFPARSTSAEEERERDLMKGNTFIQIEPAGNKQLDITEGSLSSRGSHCATLTTMPVLSSRWWMV